jgi:proline iminopeptidase
VVAAYARRMEHPSPEVRLAAARAWCAWESAVLSLEATQTPFTDLPPAEAVALVRICARYVEHGAWLEEGALIRDAGRLAGIPGVIIHGRRDMSCPIETAYALAQAWPGATLVALDDAGHLRADSSRRALLAALDGFAG